MKLRRILAGLWIILLLLAGTCYAENSDNPIVARTEYGYLRLNIPSVKKIEYYGRFYIACTYTGHTEYFVYGVPVVEEYGTYNCWFDPSKDKVLEFGKSFRDASSVWISVNHYSKDISKNNLSIYSYIRNNFPKLCNEVITDNKIADEKYGSYIEKAFEAHENKDWEKEYTYLKNAYDNGCQSQAILHDLAEACWNLGDYDNAIEWASKRIDLTNSAFAYKTRAYYYYLLEKNDLALEDAKWATMKVKDNPGIIDTRGMIYTALGQYDKALADFNAVLKINDKYASAYYHRGKCYEALGKKDNAQSDFKKAKKYDPEITDDKADFAKQRSQNQALKQQRQYQKHEKYKEDLKKLNDAVYVHNNAENFPAKVVFENDDIIITVIGNIKNNESEQFYQEVIPQEVRTNYESGAYQQHYNQMKAQVEAEQATQQEQQRAAARASGYTLGVPVTINFNPNSIHWSDVVAKFEGINSVTTFREAQIGEDLFLVKAKREEFGPANLIRYSYGLHSKNGKYYMVQYDTICPVLTRDGGEKGELLHTFMTVSFYDKNYWDGVDELWLYKEDRDASDAALKNIQINYVEDITASCKYGGKFNLEGCANAVAGFFSKVHDHIKECYANGAYYPSWAPEDEINNPNMYLFSPEGWARWIKERSEFNEE